MPPSKDIQELLQLTRDNNRLLHSMRRHAIWGGLIKFLIYSALLIAPIWFYMTYLNGAVQDMMQTVSQLQGTSARAQAQLNGYAQAWKDFQSKLPTFMQTPASTTTPTSSADATSTR